MSSSSSSAAAPPTSAQQSATLTIKIRTLDGKSIRMEVPRDIPVEDLKKQIASQSTIPFDRQRLIFRGRILLNSQRLSDFNISNEDSIHMVAMPGPGHDSSSGSAAARGTPAAAATTTTTTSSSSSSSAGAQQQRPTSAAQDSGATTTTTGGLHHAPVGAADVVISSFSLPIGGMEGGAGGAGNIGSMISNMMRSLGLPANARISVNTVNPDGTMTSSNTSAGGTGGATTTTTAGDRRGSSAGAQRQTTTGFPSSTAATAPAAATTPLLHDPFRPFTFNTTHAPSTAGGTGAATPNANPAVQEMAGSLDRAADYTNLQRTLSELASMASQLSHMYTQLSFQLPTLSSPYAPLPFTGIALPSSTYQHGGRAGLPNVSGMNLQLNVNANEIDRLPQQLEQLQRLVNLPTQQPSVSLAFAPVGTPASSTAAQQQIVIPPATTTPTATTEASSSAGAAPQTTTSFPAESSTAAAQPSGFRFSNEVLSRFTSPTTTTTAAGQQRSPTPFPAAAQVSTTTATDLLDSALHSVFDSTASSRTSTATATQQAPQASGSTLLAQLPQTIQQTLASTLGAASSSSTGGQQQQSVNVSDVLNLIGQQLGQVGRSATGSGAAAPTAAAQPSSPSLLDDLISTVMSRLDMGDMMALVSGNFSVINSAREPLRQFFAERALHGDSTSDARAAFVDAIVAKMRSALQRNNELMTRLGTSSDRVLDELMAVSRTHLSMLVDIILDDSAIERHASQLGMEEPGNSDKRTFARAMESLFSAYVGLSVHVLARNSNNTDVETLMQLLCRSAMGGLPQQYSGFGVMGAGILSATLLRIFRNFAQKHPERLSASSAAAAASTPELSPESPQVTPPSSSAAIKQTIETDTMEDDDLLDSLLDSVTGGSPSPSGQSIDGTTAATSAAKQPPTPAPAVVSATNRDELLRSAPAMTAQTLRAPLSSQNGSPSNDAWKTGLTQEQIQQITDTMAADRQLLAQSTPSLSSLSEAYTAGSMTNQKKGSSQTSSRGGTTTGGAGGGQGPEEDETELD